MQVERVVILNDRSEALGGATSLALLSARLLQARGLDVVYVTGDAGGHGTLPAGVRVEPLGGLPLLQQRFPDSIRNGLDNDSAFRLVDRLIRQEDTPHTVYHVHGWAQTLSPAIFRALAAVESRLVISAHDFSLVCPNGSFFDFQREQVCNLEPLSPACLSTHCDKRARMQKAFRVVRLLRRRQLLALSRTRALIALIHPFMLDWFVRGGASRSRLRTLRNPVTPFSQTRVEAERNTDLFFIGRLQPEKGAVLAAEAARLTGRTLRVIGEGPDRAILEARFPGAVLEGWRAHAEIADLITEARALIMPSRLPEPFGLVALEALQSGVPLIAFSDSFIAREASEVGAAFLATERSAAGLARAIATLNDDAAAAAASRAAYGHCRDLSTTPETWCEGLIALYDEQLQHTLAVQGVPA